MSTFSRPFSGRARPLGRGFSLIEVIVVIVVLGIVSGVGIASLSKTRQNGQRSAARAIAEGIKYARERALTTGRATWAYVYTNTERIDYYETVSGSVVAMTDPATNKQISTVLGSSADFNAHKEVGVLAFNGATSGSAQILGFDWQGRPTNGSGTLLTTSTTITVNQTGQTTITVTIAPESGLVSITW
jgi:prepilin-type N-terminal cleavage/methylation domain-containing protein